ncbi:MAG TPA: L,D-transpeptidase family protein [Caulobacteraceae bacterium]|nr:L,D-transpeptidase family protein [Caulobacteraceae bacterium]
MPTKYHRTIRALITGAAALALVPFLTAADTATGSPPGVSPAGPPPLSAADGAAIEAVLRDAPAQGIAAPNVAADVAQLSDPAQQAGAAERLQRAAIAYARAEHGMSLDPGSIDDDFALRAPFNAAAEFAQARANGQVGQWLDAQTRKDPAYLALVDARARYEDVDGHGGWGTIAGGKLLKAGMVDARVPALRKRLAAEGYDAPAPAAAAVADARPADAATSGGRAAHGRAAHSRRGRVKSAHAAAPGADLFDRALAKALADFQDHHGLKADGVLTPATLAALNVSAHDRLATLSANLERARWLPVAMPDTRIEVDTAGPEVALFQDGKSTLGMRAVAGETKRPTPMFASAVTAVKFNPPWIVPKDIAEKEIYPKGRGYMAREDFHVVDGRLIQRAGPKSSLGYVKFEMPDGFQVYMHDTPARSLFALSRRWRSHGCVRLENPRGLAAILLGWDPAAVDQAIAAGATKTYALKTAIPVFVVYRTAWVAPDGHASFRDDVYGWDDEIAAALAGAPEAKKTHTEAAGV